METLFSTRHYRVVTVSRKVDAQGFQGINTARARIFWAKHQQHLRPHTLEMFTETTIFP